MKRKNLRQLLSMVLVVLMLLGIMPNSLTVYAADNGAAVMSAEEFIAAV